MIGGVSVLPDDSQSSAARLGGGGAISEGEGEEDAEVPGQPEE